ncbi:hypothetical protein PIROE2DRAFT_17809 [Piromyces sp. E2]|nr:hypothetical protein PIROE2DRAFT_17809 [Piromyces sp. E2]|eukprot:OUM57263.1 hypothetical protein PIROE2DRAFT_17809 [Piromyces sp. E2]
MNRSNRRKPVLLVLIVHWFLKSTGDSLSATKEYNPSNMNTMTKENSQNWLIGIGLANVFWVLGEITADWYPLLRAKALINNNKKIRTIYITCIFYNLVKVFNIIHFFYQYYSVNQVNDKKSKNHKMTEFGISWWIVVLVTQISSFCYDLSIIICLRRNLFNQLNPQEKNTFIEKFKRISEFRIYFSMTATILFTPILLLYIIFVLGYSLKHNGTIPFNDDSMDSLRRVVITFNFTLMYIDQILLRYYVRRNNMSKSVGSSSRSKSYTPHSEPLISKEEEEPTLLDEYPIINQPLNKSDNIENQYKPYFTLESTSSSTQNPNTIDINYYSSQYTNVKTNHNLNISGPSHINNNIYQYNM